MSPPGVAIPANAAGPAFGRTFLLKFLLVVWLRIMTVWLHAIAHCAQPIIIDTIIWRPTWKEYLIWIFAILFILCKFMKTLRHYRINELVNAKNCQQKIDC